jgi:hypothetical protein
VQTITTIAEGKIKITVFQQNLCLTSTNLLLYVYQMSFSVKPRILTIALLVFAAAAVAGSAVVVRVFGFHFWLLLLAAAAVASFFVVIAVVVAGQFKQS